MLGSKHFLNGAVAGFMLGAASNALALDPISVAKPSFLNLKQDAEQAKRANRELMLMLEQEGCVYCMEMRRVNFSDKEIADYVAARFDLIQIDIWGDRELVDFDGTTMTEKEYARANKVQFTPMTLFFDGSGKEVFRMTGYYKPSMFKAALRYVAERDQHGIPTFREYAKSIGKVTASDGLSQAPFLISETDLLRACRTAATRGRGLALLMSQKQCETCGEFNRSALGQSGPAQRLTRAFDIKQIDIWGKRKLRYFDGTLLEEAQIASALDVRYTPTIIFFDGSGKEIFRFDNYRKAEHFLTILDYLDSGDYRHTASFQDWLRQRHPH